MAKKPRKSKAGISLSEFRSWLQGIEDMQDEGWSPDASQWIKIKQKISQIEEDSEVELEVVASTPTRPLSNPPSIMPTYPGTAMNRPAPIMQQPPQQFGANGATKTPDIDSSNGYTSNLV